MKRLVVTFATFATGAVLFAAPCWLLLGCSSAPPKPDPEPTIPSNHHAVNPLDLDDGDDPDGMKVEGTLGTLDEYAVQEGMQPRLERIGRCFQDELSQKPYLGGQVSFKFRIDRQGRIKWVRLAESGIGSYPVEQCMLEAARTARFERPRGGEAEFSYTLSFQGRTSPLVWDPGMVKEELEGNIEALLTAKEGRDAQVLTAPSGLQLTFYVDHTGHPISVGMTAEEDIPAEFAEPFIEHLKGLSFVKPQSRYAKVTYSW